MKHVKMLALAALAAGALMAFIGAGTASASVLCSTTQDPCPKTQDWPVGMEIDFSLLKESSSLLVNTAGEAIDRCTESTLKGKITTTGGNTSTPTGHISELTWGKCTFPTETVTKACLEVHQIAGTSNGTLTADQCTGGFANTEVTINTVLFGTCVFIVEAGKSYGDLTEGKGSGAIFHANAVAKRASGSAFACPETSKWTATYVLTSPSETTLSVSNAVA